MWWSLGETCACWIASVAPLALLRFGQMSRNSTPHHQTVRWEGSVFAANHNLGGRSSTDPSTVVFGLWVMKNGPKCYSSLWISPSWTTSPMYSCKKKSGCYCSLKAVEHISPDANAWTSLLATVKPACFTYTHLIIELKMSASLKVLALLDLEAATRPHFRSFSVDGKKLPL